MKKALIIATVAGFVATFELNDIRLLQLLGYEVYCATNVNALVNEEKKQMLRNTGTKLIQIDFSRTPFSKQMIQAYQQLKAVFKENDFDTVHCHTPVGGVLGRIVAQKYRKKGTKVIYTAHGFHFCKNAPKKNWLIFYPIERLLAHWTDVLITINEEDFALAKKHMHAKRVEYVPGVGIDLNKFSPNKMNEEEKSAKQLSLGLNDTDKVFLSVGEVNKDKNHILMIKALQQLKNNNFKYIICGVGGLMEEYKKYIQENNLDNCVKFLGYRSDISEILQIADVFVFPSTFEGLPVALMEAIASKVMVICSASRGNTDLVKDKRCLFDYRSVDELIQAIHNVENMTEEERNEIIEDNYSRLLPREKSAVIERMKEIYKETEAM